MIIPEKDITKHQWQTFEVCPCGRRHMSITFHVGKDGVYVETEDLMPYIGNHNYVYEEKENK